MKTPEHGPGITNNLRVDTYTPIQMNKQQYTPKTTTKKDNNSREKI